MNLFRFCSIRPPYEEKQEAALEWFAEAHAMAEQTLGKNKEEVSVFHQMIKEKIWHVGCKPDRIAKRASVVEDYLHRNWDEMKLFRLKEKAVGANLDARMAIFSKHSERVFEEFYQDVEKAPTHLIHVTCTGYESPSGAQKLVSKKNWGQETTVTHAYHMGCYGAIPAIRLAKKGTDIVHTEMCSLHPNPSLHQTDQLVTQTLFADGFIKYSVGETSEKHLTVQAVREEIIPNSLKAMTWNVAEWGFQMTLAKEVVVHIARSIKGYLERLSSETKWTAEELCQKALFAIHPGGPKILVHIQDLLGLSDRQMTYSFDILNKFGNMSSATLPHIWKEILEDPSVEENTPIVSLAFGPGLTIAGIILEKRCGGQH